MNSILVGFRDIFTNKEIYKPDEVDRVLGVVRKNFRFSWSNKK